VEIADPMVLVGLLLGGTAPYLFSSMCMMSVGAPPSPWSRRCAAVPHHSRILPARPNRITTLRGHFHQVALKEMLLPDPRHSFSRGSRLPGGVPCCWIPGRRHGFGVPGHLHVEHRRAWDNAKKTIETGVAAAKARTPTRPGGGRHRGRSLQGHGRAFAEHPDQIDGVMSVVIAPMLKRFWAID